MWNRGIIAAAIAAYLAIVACVLWPMSAPAQDASSASVATTRAPAMPRTGLPYRGIAIQIQRTDWVDKYNKCIDEIAEIGADTVSFVVSARQENGSSSHIYLDMRMTPTPDQLGTMIDHAKQKNLRVILMPIVLLDNPRNNEWRGKLSPESWSEWFESYREMMGHFSWIAQAHGVDVLVVGSELVTTQDKLAEWTRTIQHIRGIFKGQLTYSSNWDRYTSVPFWDQLDLIGMNSYWKLGSDHRVTIEQIEKEWHTIQESGVDGLPGLLSFLRKQNKPLVFLEVGWCSLANAAHQPWDYTIASEPIDTQLQRKLYEGFFRSWYGNPHLGGFMVWEWPPEDGGLKSRGYTPKGKPAEQLLREWLAKPGWQVK